MGVYPGYERVRTPESADHEPAVKILVTYLELSHEKRCISIN